MSRGGLQAGRRARRVAAWIGLLGALAGCERGEEGAPPSSAPVSAPVSALVSAPPAEPPPAEQACLGCPSSAPVTAPQGACEAALLEEGARFWRLAPAPEPLEGAEVMCHLGEGVQVAPELHGVRWLWLGAEARPLVVDCPLALALAKASRWLAAEQVAVVDHVGTYSCRAIRGSAKPSQHAFGRAIDVRGLRLRSGRPARVLEDWPQTEHRSGKLLRRFAETLHRDFIFNVVLTPEYNAAHRDHLHLDLTPNVHFMQPDAATALMGWGD